MVDIRDNVPPPVRNFPNAGLTATLRKMQIGQSFEWPVHTRTSVSNIYNSARKVGIKVVTSLQGEKVGVWRVK